MGCKIDNLLHSVLVEEGMAAFAGFAGEARAFEEVANIGEGDVRVGSSRENGGECFAGFAHGGFNSGSGGGGVDVGPEHGDEDRALK